MTKIEVGKTYQTRDGRTAIIDAVGCKFVSGGSILGRVIAEDGIHHPYIWQANGSYLSYFEGPEHSNDIIIPPERKSLWVNWYVKGCGFDYATRGSADENAGDDRTHVLEIITEDGVPVEVKIHEVGK